jgi:hypothetical protein
MKTLSLIALIGFIAITCTHSPEAKSNEKPKPERIRVLYQRNYSATTTYIVSIDGHLYVHNYSSAFTHLASCTYPQCNTK